ncbi:MAG TPA: hypothetical protein DEA57_00880, partial [Sulfurihydrogenibium sp.]|nr:hypothetical protein [Sulfurihydrogenibium sp.]
SDTVSAQYVIALPWALGLLEELLYILLGAAGIVFVAGYAYYLAEKVVDKVRNSSYDYFLAYISSDKKLFVGPAVDFGTAKATVLDSGDIFAKSRSLAELLAREVVFLHLLIVTHKHIIMNIKLLIMMTQIIFLTFMYFLMRLENDLIYSILIKLKLFKFQEVAKLTFKATFCSFKYKVVNAFI